MKNRNYSDEDIFDEKDEEEKKGSEVIEDDALEDGKVGDNDQDHESEESLETSEVAASSHFEAFPPGDERNISEPPNLFGPQVSV